MAYDDFRRGSRARYEDRDQDNWRRRDELRSQGSPYESGGTLASRQRDLYEGRHRDSQRVSPGGEYVGNRAPSYWPQRYESDSYTNQGYGQNRGRNTWRTEDGLFGEQEERGALDSGYGRDYQLYPGPYFGMSEDEYARRRGDYGRDAEYGWRSAYGYSNQQSGTEHRGKGPKGYRRSDERIREDVCDLLCDDPHIDASNIEVTVKDCEVTLSGSVNSRFDKRHAEDLSELIAGVRDVHNTLRVSADQGTQQDNQSTTGEPSRNEQNTSFNARH